MSVLLAVILLYEFTIKEVASFKSNNFTASVSAHAELDEDQYDKVNNAMDAELTTGVMAPPAKRQKTSPTSPKKPHEVFSKLNKAKLGMGQALTKLKDSIDKVTIDLEQVYDVKVRIVNKGWPQSLADHLEAEATVVRDLARVHKRCWAEETVLGYHHDLELPLNLHGREAELNAAQREAVEGRVSGLIERVNGYTTQKNKLDNRLRVFMTTTLRQCIKILG